MLHRTIILLCLLTKSFALLFGEGQIDGGNELKSAVGISGSTIISNAKFWLNPCVPYSQSAYHVGADGIKYRQDCSGYVSMAWQLGTSQTTSTLSQYSTKISKSELQAGDILLNAGEHTLIFEKWANADKTQYWTYEQHPDCTEYHSIPYPYWSNYDPNSYLPYRYNKVSLVSENVTIA